MRDRSPILLGRHLLDRRDFLAHLATGMGGIALQRTAGRGWSAGRRQRCRAEAPSPSRPVSSRPIRSHPNRRTFPPRPSGSCTSSAPGRSAISIPGTTSPSSGSGNGQPMPGRREADHVSGGERQPGPEPLEIQAAGADAASISPTCLPHLAECADDLCFIHSLTSKTNTHGPGEMFMSTGFTLEGFPERGRVGQLCARDREPGPARLRGDPRPARRPAARAGQLDQRLLAGRVSGDRVQRRAGRSTTSSGRRRSRPATTGPPATSSACSTTNI